jgi:uncharacterized membrane protein YphA (DoxX/SURF4 family)
MFLLRGCNRHPVRAPHDQWCWGWERAKTILVSLSLFFFFPAQASAHVKWFVEQPTGVNKVQFSLSEPAIQIGILILISAIATAIWLNRIIVEPPRAVVTLGERRMGAVVYLVQLLVGISLLVTTINGAVVAPHLENEGVLMVLMQVVQVSAAVLLIANRWVPVVTILILILMLFCIQAFGLVTPMEYCNLLGIAVFFALMKVSDKSRLAQYRGKALPILRVITGIALVVLAFTEKLLNPDLAMRFLSEHNMNFMRQIGIEAYSDYLFVLSAGFAELLFGVVLILGVVTRINIMVLACFLIASNTYFFVIGDDVNGVTEIFGHMPLFAAAIVFIIYGGDKIAAKTINNSGMSSTVGVDRLTN